MSSEPLVRCVSCKSFGFRRDRKELAEQGFGCCAYRAPFILYSAKRDRVCLKFAVAGTDVERQRLNWLDEQEVKRGRTRH